MRILLSGDSHADINHLKAIEAKINKFDCDIVFILGDYGFWPQDKGGLKFLNACSKLGFPVFFLAGNHEDHDMLDKHYEDSIGGFIQVHPNVYWTPRGLIWKWDNVTFGAMGGAYSIDRKRRVKYIDWFPQEIISEEDVENFDSRVDVLLTHDVPSMVDISTPFILEYNRPIEIDKGTDLNRERLNEIVLKAEPNKLIHGHWHMFYKQDVDTSWGKMQTIGLNCNRTSDWWTILDTEEIKNA